MTKSDVATVLFWCEIANLFVWVTVEVALSIAGAWHSSMVSLVIIPVGLIVGSAIPLGWRAWKHLRKDENNTLTQTKAER